MGTRGSTLLSLLLACLAQGERLVSVQPGSCFSWEEIGDDRTGALLSTLCPVSRYRLTRQVLQREVTVKTPGNENKVLFSRIP